MSITVDVKKKIVIGILNVFAKTGASIKQVNGKWIIDCIVAIVRNANMLFE